MVLDERDQARVNAANGNGAPEPWSEVLRSFQGDWTSLRRSLHRVALVESQRLHVRFVDAYFVVLFYACAFLAVLAVTVAGAVFAISGLRALLSRWTSGGVPELLAGLCGLSLALVASYALRAWLRFRIVRSTARRLETLGATGAAAPSTASHSTAAVEP